MEKDIIYKAVISNRILLTRTKELMKKLISELSYSFSNNNRVETLCDIIIINENIISIPVARVDLIPKNYTIVDKRISVPTSLPHFNAKLRESQQEIFDAFNSNCIINAKPGFGKTFTALSFVGKVQEKTLVIVHTVKLRNQWAKEVEKVYGFKPSIIGSGIVETSKPITVANIQTLNKHVKNLTNTFGMVIIDECHHVPSKTFKNTIDKMRARYKVGLSATLKRRDGKGILLNDYIGDKVFVPPKENTVDPIIIIRKTNIKIPGTPRTPWALRMNKVYENKAYIEEIIRMAVTQAERGHIVLVLADRISFLEKCGELTPNSKVITSKVQNQHEIEDDVLSGKSPILYASRSMYSEGVSRNEFSCIIIATAINNDSLLEQIAGRINRKNEGGRDPELVDIAFAGKTGENQLSTREAYYKREGWKVIYV